MLTLLTPASEFDLCFLEILLMLSGARTSGSGLKDAKRGGMEGDDD